jgi:nickel transport system substrate-binding protein
MKLKRKSMQALASLVLAGVMILTGCSQGTGQGAKEANANTLVYANFRDIRDLNPHLYAGELFAQNLLFESLVKIAHDGSFEPWLAKDWEISEDGKEYTFYLREDVQFSDGEKFNAEAAKANFDAILDNIERHGWLESVVLMQEVDDNGGKSVEVIDEYTLVVRLAESYYPFLVELGVTRPFRFISPVAFIEGTTKNGVSSLSGTGAYVLQENHIDEYAVFKINENYWGEKPAIEEIIAKVIPDNQTRVMALENGEIDLIYGTNLIDAATYLKFENSDDFQTSLSEPVSTRMMVINTTDEILQDVKVRQAILHAINTEMISEGIFSGIESPAYTVLSPTVPYADLGLEPYAYDKEKAKTLLEAAGWVESANSAYRQKNGQTLKIAIHYDSDSVTQKTISEFFQGELATVGIEIEIVGEEEQAHRDRMKAGDFAITFNISWGSPYDPQSFLGGMRKVVYGDYAAQLGLSQKARIDETILKALTSTDEEERQEHYRYVLTTLHEEAVYIPLTYERNRAIYSNKLDNVTFNPSQFEVPMEKMVIKK